MLNHILKPIFNLWFNIIWTHFSKNRDVGRVFKSRNFRTFRYSTLLYASLRYSTLLYATLRFSTLRYATLLYSTLCYGTLRYSTLLYTTLHYSILCFAILRNSTLRCSTSLRYSTLDTGTLQDELSKLNRLACLSLGSVPQGTPTMTLEILYDIKPLDLEMQKIACKTYMRIKTPPYLGW
jgi:uncharacterized protein YjbI with pentapeptide repeats